MLELLLMGGFKPDLDVRFLGERQPSEVISGSALAELVGLTAGTAFNDDSGWLHFLVDGQELYIAKKPFRHSVSWDQLDTQGIVYGRDIYEYEGKAFRVRLLTGGDADPASGPGGEWDNVLRLILAGRGMADYTIADLGVGSGISGHRSWMQEAFSVGITNRLWRGENRFDGYSGGSRTSATSNYGWRPVLEVIDPNTLLWPVRNIIYETDYVKSIRPFYWGYTD